MLKNRITVDLPSRETERSISPVEWVRSMLGADLDLRSGQEELTVGALSLVQGIIRGFAGAGVHNAIIFLVDQQVVYQDNEDSPHDLDRILEAARLDNLGDKPFQHMHLVLTHSEDGLHILFDVHIQNQVLLGEAEMRVEVSGRMEELRLVETESAQAYAKRIREAATAENGRSRAEEWIERFDRQVKRVAAALGQGLRGSEVSTETSRLELIRPAAFQVNKFARLPFTQNVKPATYRAVPTHQRGGAYADPFYYYYYDPYYDFTHFLLLQTLYDDPSWHRYDVHVVDPAGSPLHLGIDADRQNQSASDMSEQIAFLGSGLAASEEVQIQAAREAAQWQRSEHTEDSTGILDAADTGEVTESGGWFSGFSWSMAGDAAEADLDSSSCGSSCGGCGGCGD